jgi:imidazolonepropionase-like amidohydrolase
MHFTLQGRPASLPDIEAIKKAYLSRGVLEVRDMGNRFAAGFLARKILSGDLTVKSCGYALFRKGTYGSFLGKGVEGIEEIKREVEVLARAGADFIKVINSGIVSAAGNRLVTDGGFMPAEMKVLCEESGERGLRVACHANSDSAIREAVAAGVSSIEHGFFVSKETLHMMAEKEVAWTPTAFALLSFASSVPQDQKRYLEEVVDGHLLDINFALSAGVAVRVGSDSGSKEVCHGGSFFEELRFFRKAGLTNEQILFAACMDKGEIEKGNYLLVREDFIEKGGIEAVYVRGELQTAF